MQRSSSSKSKAVYKKYHNIVLLLCIVCNTAFAQYKTGIENYNSFNRSKGFIWMPVVHHTYKHRLYSELRYNYEALKTISVYTGKNFSGDGKINYTFTPMLGIVLGNYNGGSAALNIDVEYKKFSFSAQSQYTVSKKQQGDNFFLTGLSLPTSLQNGCMQVSACRKQDHTKVHLYHKKVSWSLLSLAVLRSRCICLTH